MHGHARSRHESGQIIKNRDVGDSINSVNGDDLYITFPFLVGIKRDKFNVGNFFAKPRQDKQRKRIRFKVLIAENKHSLFHTTRLASAILSSV